MIKIITLILALGAGNFAFQAMAGHAWYVAFERTFFQSVAIVCAYCVFTGKSES